MRDSPLVIDDVSAADGGRRILRLTGPLVISNLFDFQSRVRSDHSHLLVLDFTNVPYADSAGIGALVGAYVTHQKEGHGLLLVGVNPRVRTALQVTHVDQFFQYSDIVPAE
jgi:anti-sigma B factor antagonist